MSDEDNSDDVYLNKSDLTGDGADLDADTIFVVSGGGYESFLGGLIDESDESDGEDVYRGGITELDDIATRSETTTENSDDSSTFAEENEEINEKEEADAENMESVKDHIDDSVEESVAIIDFDNNEADAQSDTQSAEDNRSTLDEKDSHKKKKKKAPEDVEKIIEPVIEKLKEVPKIPVEEKLSEDSIELINEETPIISFQGGDGDDSIGGDSADNLEEELLSGIDSEAAVVIGADNKFGGALAAYLSGLDI